MKKFTSHFKKSSGIDCTRRLKKELVKLIIFFSISTLSAVRIIISPEPLGFKDLSPIWNFSQLFRPFDMPWDYKSNLGTPNLLLGNALYNLPIIAFSLIVRDVVIAHKLWLILLFTISGYGFYRLFNRILDSQVIGVLTGIYGVFNSWLIYHLSLGHNLILFAYAIFPFAVSSFLTSLKDGGSLKILSTGLLTALIFYVSPQIGYIFCLFALTYALVKALFSENKIKMITRNLVNFASIASISFISLLPMIANVFYIGIEVYTIRIEEITTYTMDINEAFSSQLPFTLQTLMILSFGAYLISKKKSKLKNTESQSLMSTLIILSAVGFLLYSGVSPSILIFLYSCIPGFMMLRELNKILILSVYLVAYILSIILDYLRSFFSWKNFIPPLTITILIGLPAIYPISSGNFSGSLDTVTVPWYYKTIYNALDSEANYYRVAFIPPAVWATHYNWSSHFFLDPAVSLQAKPTLEIKSEMDRTIPARFSRWIYYTLYNKRIKEVGALFGLTGVKYVIFRKDTYMPEDREDLRLFSQETSKEVLSVAENLKQLSSIGSVEIFKTDYRLPHIYACDKVSLIVGDRRILLSLLSNDKFDPISEPPVFIDNLDDIAGIFNDTGTIYIDPLRIEDLKLALAQNKTVYKVWENLPLTSNIHEEWIKGEFAWYMKDGVADTAPDGYAITSSGKPLTLNVNIPKTGNYSILVQCFLIDDKEFKGIRINLDNEFVGEINPEGESSLGNYRWISVGDYYLNSGFHKINITPEGRFGAVSKFALIPAEAYKKAEDDLKIILKNKRLFYIIEDYDWLNPNIDKFVENIKFSNGFAVKMKGEPSTPIFIPKNSTYQIYVRTSGYGNITVTVNKGETIFETKINLHTSSLKTSKTPYLNLIEGWNNLNLRTDGDLCIDSVYLYPKQNKIKTEPSQPTVEMISGSRYLIKNVTSNFIVFLEGWNNGWRLRSDDEAISPLIAFGFANLFKTPKDTERLEIEFEGTNLTSTYLKTSLILIIFIISTFFIKENYKRRSKIAIEKCN